MLFILLDHNLKAKPLKDNQSFGDSPCGAWLIDKIDQGLMVHEEITFLSQQIVSNFFETINHDQTFSLRGVVLFCLV